MPTEWRAPFRKLQERCSTSWLRLPAWVRGYGDEMIRFAERPYGRVCDTADAADVAFRIRAHDSELERVTEAVRLLTTQGFLSTEQDGLYITNFPKAQENYETARKREQRDRDRAAVTTVPVCPGLSGHVPQEERREEEIREEKPPVVPLAGDGPGVRLVFECWQTERKKPRAKLDRKRRSRIKARLSEGFTPEQLCEAVRNAKNDPFLMGQNDTGRVYDGIETLLRDAGQVERLAELKAPLPVPDRKPPGMRQHEETRLPSNYKTFPVVKDVGRRVPGPPPRLAPAPPDPSKEAAAKAAREAKERADRERWEREFAAEAGGES